MSAPVDVLAVMDEWAAEHRRLANRLVMLGESCEANVHDREADDLTEARAAVAELVEAARDFRDCLTVHDWSALTAVRRAELLNRYQPPQFTRPMRATEARFAAALARVQP